MSALASVMLQRAYARPRPSGSPDAIRRRSSSPLNRARNASRSGITGPSAHGFQTAAGDYQRARPDYSDEAGRWLAERLDLRSGRKVVGIAAGTDKLTRALVATAARSSRSSRWRGCGSGWMRR